MYEIIIIHKPDANSVSVQEEVSKIITTAGGTITSTNAWGEKRLTFQMLGYPTGVFTLYTADLPESGVSQLSKQLGFVEELLRARVYKKEA